jgi:hypothetical protein
MVWETAVGQLMEMAYESIPDGKKYPYENPAVAEAVSMTRVSPNQLDSATFKGGQMIAHASRTLSTDKNTMTVVQSGQSPEGKTFRNLSIYRRQQKAD